MKLTYTTFYSLNFYGENLEKIVWIYFKKQFNVSSNDLYNRNDIKTFKD